MPRILFGLVTLLLASSIVALPSAAQQPRVAAVMAPLSFMPSSCKNFDGGECRSRPEVMAHFDWLLGQAREAGVTAVSVDMWWRLIEPEDNSFDFTYYDQIFDRITAAGLKIAPILSFHKCGDANGDQCDFPLPDWIWTRFNTDGLSPDDLKYQSEAGNWLVEALPPWATAHPAVLKQLSEVMRAFRQHYDGRAQDFIEVNISLGPTGELRYPSYSEPCSGFPDRGNFVAYGRLAQESFREWALRSFGGLSGVAARWEISLSDAAEIRPPNGNKPASCNDRRAQSFVGLKDYKNIRYGKDFVDWYNLSLVQHGERLLRAADEALDGPLASVPLGMKIAGVHWNMTCVPAPRISEVTAGLVQTSLNLDPTDTARADGYGYKAIMDMITRVKEQTGRPVILHFTALEKPNGADPSSCPTSASGDATSMAEALVFWIARSATDHGVMVRGENALCPGGWDHVKNAFQWAGYTGFNLLRLIDEHFYSLTGFQQDCKWDASTKSQYQQFIAQCIAQSCAVH